MSAKGAGVPPAKPVRWLVAFRMARAAVEYVDNLATQEGIVDASGPPNRSEMLRILLSFAVRNWKRGWRP